MSPIDAALASLEALKPGESINYAQVARAYGCDRNTLSRRHREVQGTMAKKIESSQLLSKTQEKELIKYIDGLCERGLPPSRQMIRNFAAEIGGREAGKSWVDRFIKRYDIDLISRWTSGMDSSRKRADSAFKYSLYFELLRRKIEQYNVEPRHLYNMDEKGFLIGILSKMKRIFTKQRYEDGGVKQIIQDGNREWITTIACICADGTSLTPALIYQALTGNIQDTWLQDFNPAVHKAFFASSPSGWTNNTLGIRWLEQVFNRETKAKARQSYRLLILDGHGSHVNMEFINYCDKNKILLALYPPHSTHTLQPLDVCLFKPLSTAYSTALADHMDKCQGLSSITKRDFFRLFNQAWEVSFQEKTILSAFEKCGLSPFNPQRVLARFSEKEGNRASSCDSSTSVLSASDWRKIERLLREVATSIYDKSTQQLSQTIHSISVRNVLLKDENTRLKEALINERKKRQRGKPLLLEVPAEYNGGAQFWSPNKVQEARERQAQRDAEAEALQHQKEEEQLRKVHEKAEKARMLEERKRLRATAKEIRLQAQAEKAALREAAKLHQQSTQHQARASKKGKGKQKVTTPPSLSSSDEVDDEESDVEVGAPTPARSRRTRQINLPTRFRE
jgi:hypothetical protein